MQKNFDGSMIHGSSGISYELICKLSVEIQLTQKSTSKRIEVIVRVEEFLASKENWFFFVQESNILGTLPEETFWLKNISLIKVSIEPKFPAVSMTSKILSLINSSIFTSDDQFFEIRGETKLLRLSSRIVLCLFY